MSIAVDRDLSICCRLVSGLGIQANTTRIHLAVRNPTMRNEPWTTVETMQTIPNDHLAASRRAVSRVKYPPTYTQTHAFSIPDIKL